MTNNNFDPNYDPEFEKDKKNSEHDDQSELDNEIKPDFEEDRDIPSLNAREHTQGKKLMFYGILFIVFVAIFFGLVVFAKNYAAYKQQKKAEEAAIAEKKKTNVDFKTDRIEQDQAAIAAVNKSMQEYPPMEEGAASEAVTAQGATGQQTPNYQPPVDNYKSPEPQYNNTSVTGTAPNYSTASGGSVSSGDSKTPIDRKLGGSILVSGGKSGSGATGASAATLMGGGQEQGDNAGFMPNGGGRGGNSAFSKQYQSTAFEATTAMQRNNLSLLLKQGTMIPCVLKTKIVSTYAGQTACQVTKDVYSANGKTLLIERGSSVIGEQTVKVDRGSARVFVLWSKLDTPKGVSFTLDSGTVDNLGASGMNAKVNNHFWQRFGGAILLSVIEDGLQTIANKNSNSQSGGISYNSTSDSTKEMANTALENSINIPPTATVNQGTLINIFVARDVDFTGVYKLAKR
ncbi:type IV secretion system protein VirB10 [Acinetobacter baumannii]|uniref:type IV secretion system protein VirB10 n=1 Tax=Acinetobacter baumannii TaxID=470 RepID=UPI00234100CC|nr:type IV secretion system protein VirB10 [Acinetobacter baumannii]MDC4147464.1 type IV secretion system protein VirB10 [Acinetobacter baumannii]